MSDKSAMTGHARKYAKMSEAKKGKPWAGSVRRIVVHVRRDTYFAVLAKAQKFVKIRASHVLPDEALEAYVEWLLERHCVAQSAMTRRVR